MKLLIYILVLTLFFACRNEPTKKEILAVEGVLDLTSIDFGSIETINLDGEWDFYWNQFYSYEEISQKKIPPDLYFKVPGVWNDLIIKNEKLTGDGFCTLSLLVKLPDKQKSLALRIPIIETAHKLWANGELIYEAGKIAKSKEEMVPYILRAIKPVTPNEKNEILLTLQISNYMSRTGGVPGIFLLGDIKNLYQQKFINLTFDMFILGSLFIMGVYHLGLFLIRKKDKSAFFFGIFCLDFALRFLVTDERILLTTFPFLPFSLTYKIEFGTAYLLFPLFATFVYYLFQNVMHRYYLRVLWVLIFFLCSVVLFFPPNIYTQFQFAYEILILVSIPYVLYVNVLAIKRKLDGAAVSFFGIGILVLGTVIDILQSENIIYGHYAFPFCLFGFLFFQTFSLSIKFSRAFSLAENLTVDLTEQKKSLSIVNQELTELQKDLEKKVKQKGEELERVYQENILEIQKVNSLEKELAIQKERQKIFTDIHDHMGSNILDLNIVLGSLSPGEIIPEDNLDQVKLSLRKLEDNLRMKMFSIGDLEIFEKDPINGIRLLIQRRYSIYNREIHFFCEEGLYEIFEKSMDKKFPSILFSICQENASNDLKYGFGFSSWNFFIHKQSICLEIMSNTKYNKSNILTGNGKKNISNRLKELNGNVLYCEEDKKFHARFCFPIQELIP